MFQCVRIPANDSAAMESISLSKSGGLTQDALAAHAKQYFVETLLSSDAASDPVAVASCLDIMAVTVPTAGNDFRAVSLYKFGGDASARSVSQPERLGPVNQRAMDLVTACGHAIQTPIHGDVFVGRAHDNETADIWERMDFTVEDANPQAEWCRVARSKGGGGGSGRAAAASLSGIMMQQQQQMQAIGGEGTPENNAAFGLDGTALSAQGYSWTQDGEEVELKFSVAPEILSRNCKVHFGRHSVKIVVSGKVLLNGMTYLPIVADESTYTLTQETGSSTKDLAVTLIKEESGKTWTFVTVPGNP